MHCPNCGVPIREASTECPRCGTKFETKRNPIADIAEILGLLEEARKGKNWILQEIKKQKLNVPIKKQ